MKKEYDRKNSVQKVTRWPADVYEALRKIAPRNKEFSAKVIEGARLLLAARETK